MYNIKRDGATLNESEILGPLHYCVRECLDNDINSKSHHIEYTDHDVVAATLMLVHICTNRLIHDMERNQVPLRFAAKTAGNYADLLYRQVRSMTGIDVRKHFKYGDKK